MLRLLERDLHGQRLRDLLSRFRDQELCLGATLHQFQVELDAAQRAAAHDRMEATTVARQQLRLCSDLQLACDQLAMDLVHVRMAIAGAREELEEHDRLRFVGPRRSEPVTRLVTTA